MSIQKNQKFTLSNLAQKFGLYLIIQFGSSINPDRIKHSESDIDIAVLANKTLSLGDRIELNYQLAKYFNVSEDKIDLIDLRRVNSLLAHQIATNGLAIYDSNNHQYHQFYMTAKRRYIDETPLYELESEMLDRKVRSFQ